VLAVDASGRAAVLWSKVVSSTLSQVMSGSMAADGVWTVDGVVGDSDRFSAVTLTMAMNRAGDALAGWSRGSDASSSDSVRSVTVVRRVAGGAWGAPETIARDADAGDLRAGLDVASDGSAIAGWMRRAPTGLAGVPVAAVRTGGGPWSAPVDLTLPKEGSSLGRHIAGVALDDAGHGVAAWSDGPGGLQTWIARFSPTSVPPKRVPTRLLKFAGPTSGVAGTLVNLEVTLNQAVERAPAEVQRRVGTRWRTVRAVAISGRKLRVAVRLPQPGSHRYRLVMRGVGTSAVVTIRSTRSTTPSVPVCERAQQAVAGAGAVWVRCAEAAGQTLWKIDTARRRRVGAPVQIGATTDVAVGRGVVWLLEHERIVPVDATTLRVGTPIELTPGADEAAIQIATDGGNVWVLLGPPDVPFGGQTLVRIDGGTRQITMRVALPASTRGEGSQAIIPGARGIWIPRRLFEMGHDYLLYLLRVDRVSGRVTRVNGAYDYGLVAGGPSGLWGTRATTGVLPRKVRLVRIDPPAGPAGSDLSRLSLRALVVGKGRIWGDTTRKVRGANRLAVRLQHYVLAINPATARPVGVLKPIGPVLESGDLRLVPDGRRAWALIPELGVLLGVPSR
jgi:hypothetical protein